MQHFTRFAPIAERYDGFILDLWGVIHDGIKAFPAAVDCLRHLRERGKSTLLLSNVPRPNASVRRMMREMGIDDDLYGALLTSGEAVRNALLNPPDLWWANLGRRVFHLGPDRDRPVLDGLSLDVVADPTDATFVLNTGPDDHRNPTDLAEFETILRDCARHRLPMVCANPDLDVIRGGIRVLCAGALAARYRDIGGDVRALGKPDPAIYQPAIQALQCSPARILAVGDSLRTDITGADAVGLDSCWVLGGLHVAMLTGPDGRLILQRAEEIARLENLRPVATIPGFAW